MRSFKLYTNSVKGSAARHKIKMHSDILPLIMRKRALSGPHHKSTAMEEVEVRQTALTLTHGPNITMTPL